MPYYAGLRREEPATRKRIAEGLIRLQKSLVAQKVPKRTLGGDLLIASWNIREFDSTKYGDRVADAYYYIAEVLNHFDLIAIQEVNDDLRALDRVRNLLGSWWKYVVTDVSAKAGGGNDERMAFLYDGRKVTFDGLAGEIVLPPTKVDGLVLQFARTPFVCGFRSGWAKIDLCTVHIYYGDDKALNPRRLEEIQKLAKFLADRARQGAPAAGAAAPASPPTSKTLILLGDFNIFSNGDATLSAITDAGFSIPKVLTERTGTNIDKSKFYDQIAIWRGDRFDETERGGVFDFYEAVFRAEDEPAYENSIPKESSGRRAAYKTWKTFQMSDHLVLWAAFKVDFAEDYLNRIATEPPKDPS
ncbi:endonuclease/exonuclease/phosphatase family protein [Methylopila sp. M107]|uniref:endonuclease/exonuclease/phosphatase family protein n=1 Tax=Methylopila sp. M107 TaxID=1101190 RepID=UPI000370152A|nr:endonuclease/exonuclease/phosphatase family protein [Methylopila sp. M107]